MDITNNYTNGCSCKNQESKQKTHKITKRPVDWAIWTKDDIIGFIGIAKGDTMPETLTIHGQEYKKS